jgi:hypothetical protein
MTYLLKIKRIGDLPARTCQVCDVAEASRIVRARIEDADVGSSEYGGTVVVDGSGRIAGHVAYNGRVFSGAAWTSTASLLYDPAAQ